MADPRTILRDLDRLDTPVSWSDVRRRTPGAPPPEPRRTGRLLGIGVAFAIAAAGILLLVRAFVLSPGGPTNRGPISVPAPPTPLSFTSPNTPWTFEYPSGWSVATTRRADPSFMANMLRTVVANGPLPDRAGDFGPNSGGDSELTSALGDSGAVVLVERFWVHAAGIGGEPRGPGPYARDAQSPGWTFRERARCEGTLCFHVIEWLGPKVSDEDRAAAAATAASVRLADVERWTETDGERTTLHDEDDLFTVTYPAAWIPSDRPINTWVSSPREILALATYPLRPGGEAVTDFQLPGNAVEDLGPDDILIWVSEAGTGDGFPARPEHLEPSEPCDEWSRLCPEPTGQAVGVPGIRAWWLGFRDAGRGIYVFVGMGERAYADPARAQLAWDVLDSLRFGPR